MTLDSIGSSSDLFIRLTLAASLMKGCATGTLSPKVQWRGIRRNLYLFYEKLVNMDCTRSISFYELVAIDAKVARRRDSFNVRVARKWPEVEIAVVERRGVTTPHKLAPERQER